jgi:hypothetical protein
MIWAAGKTIGTFLFDRFGGKALTLAAGVFALFAWWQIDRALLERRAFNEGASNAKQGFEAASHELADRMGAAASRAADGDAAERLRRKWCIDC